MRSVTTNHTTHPRGGSRQSGAGDAAGPTIATLGRRVAAGASAAVALHLAARARGVTEGAPAGDALMERAAGEARA